MTDTTNTPGFDRLERVYDANSSWREMLGDLAMRAAIFDSDDDFDDTIEYFNECGLEDAPDATVEDLSDFLQPSILAIQARLEEQEETKDWTDLNAFFFWRAAEDCDTEALLECLEERYPGFHAFVLENREDD